VPLFSAVQQARTHATGSPRLPRRSFTIGLALATLTALSGCGQDATSTTAVSNATTVTSGHTRTVHRRRPRKRRTGRRSVLAYSTASAHIVQPQPPAGSCRALGRGLYSRPDPRCTPGALDPSVTQTTIDRTICVPGFTAKVRPPESITETEKINSMAAYGDGGPTGGYEYDHFIPLELGGAVNDPRNLWPEPGASPNPKDAVEDTLHSEVCAGQVTLTHAQHAVASDWIRLTRAASPSIPSAAGGQCSLSASYSSRYDDYDVYVHSNQPDHTVTVTDGSGHRASWRTDSTGYADVYFKAPATASGEPVTAHVGTATCYGRL
jgi:hypothetical protein